MQDFYKRVLIFLAGATMGGVLHHNRNFVDSLHYTLANKGLVPYPTSNRISDNRDQLQKSPQKVPFPDVSGQRVAVLLTAGQSNAANHGAVGEPFPNDDPNILNLHKGSCYVARHPLLGATGANQSPWIEVARQLLASGNYDKVVIIATAIGGTAIHEWAPGGQFHERLLARIREANALNLSPTHFLWHQGEGDACLGTQTVTYQEQLAAIIKAVRNTTGRDTPVYLALATRCTSLAPVPSIRQAQQNVANVVPFSYIAVDSDLLGLEYRFDGVHMTQAGQNLLATGFSKAILSTSSVAQSVPGQAEVQSR